MGQYDVRQAVNKGVKSGMKPKMAIASALAKKRKYAMGGEVEMPDEDDGDSMEPGMPVYPMDDDSVGLSDSVVQESKLAEHLQADKYAANDNTVDYDPYYETKGQKMNQGGVAQPEQPNIMVGNKPDLMWIDDGTEEKMSSMPNKPSALGNGTMGGEPSGPGLSEEAKRALMMKKKTRRYGSYDPR